MPLPLPRAPYPPHWTDHFGDDLTAADLVAAAAERRESLEDFLRWESLRLYNHADLEQMARYAAQITAEAGGGYHVHA